MANLEAVYLGIDTERKLRGDVEIFINNAKYEKLAIGIAQILGPEMQKLPEFARHETPASRAFRKFARGLVRGRNQQARANQEKWEIVLAFSNPARTAVHAIFDTLSVAAEVSETSRVSMEPEAAAEQCLAGSLEGFEEESGIGEEHRGLVIRTAAQVLGATAFNVPRRRRVEDPMAPEQQILGYKSWEISSTGQA